MSRVGVAVVGASGYTGAELLRLLHRHPGVEIRSVVAGRRAGERLDAVFPQFTDCLDLTLDAFDAEAIARDAEVAFTALPHGASAAAVAELHRLGVTVIDLSADFRLPDADLYARWYGSDESPKHPAPELLAEAAYGLPELWRDEIRSARIVACPGCYPTSAILPVAPLLVAGLVSPDSIVVDSKSGVSGAGRSPGLGTHFPEAGEGIRPYKVAGTHRHTPEIASMLTRVAGADVSLTFTPQLVPMSRGILSCVYARVTDESLPESAYRDAIAAAYRDEPFVTVLGDGRLPDTSHTRGGNRIHIAVRRDPSTKLVVAMAAIDNLVKGAAGQAVQCMNLLRGDSETLGLEGVAQFP